MPGHRMLMFETMERRVYKVNNENNYAYTKSTKVLSERYAFMLYAQSDRGLKMESPIANFYEDSTIFITGATGFLGRILLEKLLRSCPGITKFYLLIRPKEHADVKKRLADLLDDCVFKQLRAQRPLAFGKIAAVSGDCEIPNLGLSDDEQQLLLSEVTIVFHVAATVNFTEKLQKATLVNVRGTRDVIRLCKQMKRLKFVTHTSTVYAHCSKLSLHEDFYDTPYKPNDLIYLAERFPQEIIEGMTKCILDKFPNTYAFTKSISEEIIKENSDLPIALFRPAIIVAAYKEPLPGWINNLYGPQGVTMAAMLGLLRSLHCNEDLGANIVPVDMCANALIAIPWDACGRDPTNAEKVPIYHYDSDSYNPIDWRRFRHLSEIHGSENPSSKIVGPYFFHLRKTLWKHQVAVVLMHYLPALIGDCFLFITNKKRMFFKTYRKMDKFMDVISFFCTNKFVFNSRNMKGLWSKMSPFDRQIFLCDVREIDWNNFFYSYLIGIRLYLIKDPLSNMNQAKAKFLRFQLYGKVFIFVIIIMILSLIIYLLNTIFNKIYL